MAGIAKGDMALEEFYGVLAATGLVRRLLEIARDEDLQRLGDVTSLACIPPEAGGRARCVAREAGVVAGLRFIPEILGVFGVSCGWVAWVADGDRVQPGATLGELEGGLAEILKIERTVLNLVGRLSGIATRTALYAERIRGVGRAGLYDTRKTTPGLRVFEKYAVRCGGGRSHRMGLHDAVLIKDNHIAHVPAGALGAFVERASEEARARSPIQFFEVEVDTLEQLGELLALPEGVVDIVLLDNMGPAMLGRAVEMRDSHRPGVELEASGGVTLETIRDIAASGVDRISVGGLTHHAVSLDVALDVDPIAKTRP